MKIDKRMIIVGVFVIAYAIVPDLFPGPIDDIIVIAAGLIYNTYHAKQIS